jgi:hypothetical protein
MGHHCARWSGILLIGVALIALPSAPILESYAGGSAVLGRIENGRFIVDPGHGQPIAEVSESLWWTVYGVERVWPFSALIPGFAGLFLLRCGMEPSWKPVRMPTGDPPPWVMREILVSVGVVVAGTLLCWFLSRTPWVTMVVAWILACITVGRVTWLWMRELRGRPNNETDPSADRTRY